MILRPKLHLSAKHASLPQQQADFTAEGAPPPGEVSTAGVVTPNKTPTRPAKAVVAAVRKGVPTGRSRWQR
jgi:hypothetical protein